MKRLRVLVLSHKDLVPPEGTTDVPKDRYVEWKTDFDVMSALGELKHEILHLGVENELGPIRDAVAEFKPHIVFNLMEAFHDLSSYNYYVTSYLEMLRQPYSGCNPRGLMLSRDKALCRKVLSHHRVPSPGFTVFHRGRVIRKPAKMKLPMVVKTLSSDGSVGVSQASFVETEEKLKERTLYLHETFELDVIAEEYIPGREVYVGILGNRRLIALPAIELDFGKLSEGEGATPIATSKVKWDWKYQEERGIKLKPAKLTEEVERRLVRVAKRVYRGLSLSGYGRIDFRITDEGIPYLLEANPNCDLGYGEELHEAGKMAGMSYSDLMQRILNLGMTYQAEWRQVM